MQAHSVDSGDRADTDLRMLWVGVGYGQDTSRQLIETAIRSVCLAHNLAERAIAGLATLDSKTQDSQLIDLCHDRQWQLRGFPASDLGAVAVSSPSAIVAQLIGTPSISEAAAILAATDCRATGENLRGFLRVSKQIFRQDGHRAVTVAIAQSIVLLKESF
ncbi:MAG: cobalamin biosynthesis protein [Drouetiella hepatica Uher 2000/2452]|jgi:cobalt-precorrin 5A hydrolase/precorrin-3B C17-methyltransferase|uniref:Cobalamin biosynthesis protein n=1 Tax=Drouetiella hepatica Uher 2000/2452 TaxID=904376 RepID=A0A951Q8E4_9CYAN|nr:cobalamin biosynthesis protein [Drouetiella hepatica Uher 2000/2452]